MPTRILVSGSNGQLGRELQKKLPGIPNSETKFTDLPDMDITSRESLDKYFRGFKPDVFINCSAYTNVDKAESEKADALLINHKGTLNIAEICRQNNTLLIHISTDYVFDGESFRPYQESYPTNPVNFYGKTKALGEEAVQSTHAHAIIIRTSWLYSQYGNNFVKTMVRLGQERVKLGVVDDQVGNPTYAGDLANAIGSVIEQYQIKDNFEKGIYHFSNEGVCSWYDFAMKIQEITGSGCQVNPIETKDYPTPAKRPFYSVLSKKRIKNQFGIDIPHWEESLKYCLYELANQKKEL